MSLSIAFFGSSLVSAYWNGAATYYRGVLQALAAQAGTASRFTSPTPIDRQRHRDIPDPDWARVVVYPATEDGVEHALEKARNADLLVKASGVGVFDALLEARIPALKRPGAHRRVLGCRCAGHAGPDRRRSRRPVPRADPGLRHRVHLWRRTAGRCRLPDVRRPNLRADL